jgi:hypothetical protein
MNTSSTTGPKCRRCVPSAAGRRLHRCHLADLDLSVTEDHRFARDHDEQEKKHPRDQESGKERQEQAYEREPVLRQWTPPCPEIQLPPVPV